MIVSALLHDINHVPFLHTLQEYSPTIFSDEAIFREVMTWDFSSYAGRPHEPLLSLLDAHGFEMDSLQRVLYADWNETGRLSDMEHFTKSALNGGVDVDKMSYLTLDALYTGVPHGMSIDLRRLMRAALMTRDEWGRECLAFDTEALADVDAVMLARLASFRDIYWHPRHRSLMSMFLHVMDHVGLENQNRRNLLREFLVSDEEDVVRRMNVEYQKLTGLPSPMEDFTAIRGAALYRELYCASFDESRDESLLAWLPSLSRGEPESAPRRETVSRELASELMRRNPRLGSIEAQEIVIDVPGRRLNIGPDCLLRDRSGEIRRARLLSGTADAVIRNLERMTGTFRIFVSPRIADELGLASSQPTWVREYLAEMSSLLHTPAKQRLS